MPVVLRYSAVQLGESELGGVKQVRRWRVGLRLSGGGGGRGGDVLDERREVVAAGAWCIVVLVLGVGELIGDQRGFPGRSGGGGGGRRRMRREKVAAERERGGESEVDEREASGVWTRMEEHVHIDDDDDEEEREGGEMGK